jgi:hypothetical protein
MKYCLIWKNPSLLNHPQARLLQTITTDTTPAVPRAFPIEQIQKLYAKSNLLFATNETELTEKLPISSQEAPIIITTKLATEVLGWETFQCES